MQPSMAYRDRTRCPSLPNKLMPAHETVRLFKEGMTVGMSGFTKARDANTIPAALQQRARSAPLRLTLLTGISLGNASDGLMAEAGLITRRRPFQSDATLRRMIKAGASGLLSSIARLL